MPDDMDIPMPSMMPADASAWRAGRRPGLDTVTRRVVLFAGVIGGVVLLMVAGWSLTGHHARGIPVVEPDARPLRTKPENAGGMQVAGQDDAILSGDSAAGDGVAPPPETPDPQALAEQAATPAPSTAPAAAPAAAAASDSTPDAASGATSAAAEEPAALPPPAPAAGPASATSTSATSASATPASAIPASAIPAPAASAPVPAPAPARVSAARSEPVASRAGGAQVQLAALDSEALARTEWERLLHRMPELLGGRSPIITRLERGDGKVFWRLRTAGFSDIAQATAFCEKVRERGAGCNLEPR